MSQSAKKSGLIRMALMSTAFITLTIILIVFQPGSPRRAQIDVSPDIPASVTREAVPLSTEAISTHSSATPPPMVAVAPAPAPQAAPPVRAEQTTNMRDMTFSAISNLKSVTTGETPAPGQPGSLLHSVVQRSMTQKAPTSAPSPILTEVKQVRSEADSIPSDGTYLVRPGDTLLSISKELYCDTAMSTDIFRSNTAIMLSTDSLKPGMVLKLPSP